MKMIMIVACAFLSTGPQTGLDDRMHTVLVTADRISIASDDGEAAKYKADGTRGGGIIVQCNSPRLSGMPDTTVFCEDCAFTSAAGVKGFAKNARFNVRTGVASFQGTDDNPVRLFVHATSGKRATTIIGKNVAVNLTALVTSGVDGLQIRVKSADSHKHSIATELGSWLEIQGTEQFDFRVGAAKHAM
jgi:hypothetical protein